jgi:hypothetical protein
LAVDGNGVTGGGDAFFFADCQTIVAGNPDRAMWTVQCAGQLNVKGRSA